MLSLFSRAAAGRTLSAASASTTSKIVVPVFAATPRVRRLAPIARSFSASGWIRFPAATDPTGKPKKKSTAAKKKKKAAATKKPAAKKKKVLTPEQKQKKELTQLRKMALPKAPKGKPANVWTVYLADSVSSGSGVALGDKVKDISAQFKNLSEQDKAVR